MARKQADTVDYRLYWHRRFDAEFLKYLQALMSPKDAYLEMRNTITRESRSYLRNMPYDDFLQTLYWRVLRRYHIWKNHRACSRCGRILPNLELHHETYDHRGDELSHPGDVVLLCPSCHEAEHVEASDVTELLKTLITARRPDYLKRSKAVS